MSIMIPSGLKVCGSVSLLQAQPVPVGGAVGNGTECWLCGIPQLLQAQPVQWDVLSGMV